MLTINLKKKSTLPMLHQEMFSLPVQSLNFPQCEKSNIHCWKRFKMAEDAENQ